jgi:Ca-activated chloride channel family protein
MDWLWPGSLLLLGLIPLIVAAYVWMLRRRRRFAVRYSSLALVREALPHQSRLRRHLPFALFLLALAGLVIALGRPVATVSVPAGQTIIILAIDVSRSMCATDIQPNRLEAAKAAALSFIQRQDASMQIGIVAFAGFAELIQPPTSDQELLQDAVESLTTARRTAIGSGILESLDAIAEIDPNVAPSVSGASPAAPPAPVPRGAYAPDIIVLLTDGVSNAGPLPLDAAQQAVDRGVRVYTIGFGTANENQSLPYCGQPGGDPFGGGGLFGGGGGGRFRRGIDEETLKQVAAMTGGSYYSATSAGELQSVFQNLPTHLITRLETIEISVAFTAIGALLAAIAIGLSLIWHPLP